MSNVILGEELLMGFPAAWLYIIVRQGLSQGVSLNVGEGREKAGQKAAKILSTSQITLVQSFEMFF